LREYAGLVKEIVLVGVVDHFEIWSRENWNNEEGRFEQSVGNPELKKKIGDIGL
jgi:MraZ protein